MPNGNVLKGMNLFQTDGSRNTYYKRYALLGMLGIVTEDEDADAKGQFKDKPKIVNKPKLDDAKLQKAISGIKTGQYQVEELKTHWDISPGTIRSIKRSKTINYECT